MFLDYLSLAILLMGLVVVFYTFIYIHDLLHKIAKQREHPHEEAIHVACWLSLFTLHAIWPLVFIWSVSHKKEHATATAGVSGGHDDPVHRLTGLEERLRKLEAAAIHSEHAEART